MPKSFLNMAGYPLGLRNNNPGNIRPFDDWKGMIGTNAGFAVFKDISWGLRAFGISLLHEINVGNNTPKKIIYEWAPPSDGNDTEAYISRILSTTGFSRDQILTGSQDTLKRLIRSMMQVELGTSYANMITDQDIIEGLKLIGGQITPEVAATGFGVSVLLFFGAIYLLATMPKAKQS